MDTAYVTDAAARHREIITKLYYLEGLTLSEVIERMKEAYNFKATLVSHSQSLAHVLTFFSVKMYKTRIKTWGLTKYNKSATGSPSPRVNHRMIVRSIGEGSVGAMPLKLEDTNVVISADQTPRDKLASSQIMTANDQYLGPGDDSELRAELSSLLLPDEVEACLRTIFEYTNMHVETGNSNGFLTMRKWHQIYNTRRPPPACAHIYLTKEQSTEPKLAFFRNIERSITCGRRGNFLKAGRFWREAFLQLEMAPRSLDPDFLMVLLWGLDILVQYGHTEVARSMQQQILKFLPSPNQQPNLPYQLLQGLASLQLHRIQCLRPAAVNLLRTKAICLFDRMAWLSRLNRSQVQ